MLRERARGRLADAAGPYLLEGEILQNVMPATRGANPLLIVTLGAAVSAMVYHWLPLLVSVAAGALIAAVITLVTTRAVVLVATDHAVVVLQASWFDHRPTGIEARLPRESSFHTDHNVYAPVELGESRFWVPFVWTEEADQADDAWAAVGRTPSLN